ncbi:MAG: 3-hydroxyacyl-CoA dehydrogenase NAD-binding domain-containing protein [Candidatus Angelobacter sp.]
MAEIRTIAVIGAGAVGRGIAFAAALGGYRTILEDILPSSLRTAAAELREHLSRATDLGAVSKPEALAAFNRLEYAATVEHAAREADLVIEAAPDELESKIEIFTLLDKICKPQTILVSNTTVLSVSDIASVTYRAAKIAGMRFGNPASSSKTLQIVRAQLTDGETIAACAEVGKRMGKQVTVIAESDL